jgi:peptidoglycan hydrolase-like protein with peptidoglycan-binding domain
MTTTKKYIYIATLALFCGVYPAHGQTQEIQQISQISARHFNGPSVSDITSTSAIVSLSRPMLESLAATNPDRINQGYFEYYKTNQVCPAIYPTPEYCLPKKTNKGVTSVQLSDLTPNTAYSVVFKKDNTINCITAPCPANEYRSLVAEFVTPISGQVAASKTQEKGVLTKNIGFRARGADVTSLQLFLVDRGLLASHRASGYFGQHTLRAVREYQKSQGISPTGFVGAKTREKINMHPKEAQGEIFEGTITAVSTGCFSDGECSITVDGKKVVTTIGWSQAVVGSIFGSVSSVGDAESKIGSKAVVFAKKTKDGYTLYGNRNFYIEVK